MNRTAIIVSPYFPPSTLAGVHRARHLAKYLPAAGWTPVVLCVHEACHEEQLDPELAALVPASVEVQKVAAVPARLCRPFSFGEISLRAWFPLRRALFNLLAARPVGVVLITGSPYYPMLLAKEVRRRFGVPVVLDFQDPWVSSFGATQPGWSKAGIAHRLAVRLEPKALRAADFITSVSEIQNSQMAARYPWFDTARMAAIPIGGDPEDFEMLRRRGARTGKNGVEPADGKIHLTYVGTIWPSVLDTVRVLLRGLRRVRETQPSLYPRLRVDFVGTDARLNAASSSQPLFSVTAIAEQEGVGDAVNEYPRRVPFLDALSIQARSHAIVMLGSAEPHYTASKIFSVLMSGRPYLAVFHRSSSSHEILLRAGGGAALSFATGRELHSLEAPIADALVKLATAPASYGAVDPAGYAPFTAAAVARRYGQIFDRVFAASCSRRGIALEFSSSGPDGTGAACP